MAAQFTATNGPARRAEEACRILGENSLPPRFRPGGAPAPLPEQRPHLLMEPEACGADCSGDVALGERRGAPIHGPTTRPMRASGVEPQASPAGRNGQHPERGRAEPQLRDKMPVRPSLPHVRSLARCSLLHCCPLDGRGSDFSCLPSLDPVEIHPVDHSVPARGVLLVGEPEALVQLPSQSRPRRAEPHRIHHQDPPIRPRREANGHDRVAGGGTAGAHGGNHQPAPRRSRPSAPSSRAASPRARLVVLTVTSARRRSWCTRRCTAPAFPRRQASAACRTAPGAHRRAGRSWA